MAIVVKLPDGTVYSVDLAPGATEVVAWEEIISGHPGGGARPWLNVNDAAGNPCVVNTHHIIEMRRVQE